MCKPANSLKILYSETCIKRPRLGQKRWSLNRGGLLIEVKPHGKAMGHDRVVFEYRWSQEQVSLYYTSQLMHAFCHSMTTKSYCKSGAWFVYECTYSALFGDIIAATSILQIFPAEMLPVSGSTSKASLSSTFRSEPPTTATATSTSTCKHNIPDHEFCTIMRSCYHVTCIYVQPTLGIQ